MLVTFMLLNYCGFDPLTKYLLRSVLNCVSLYKDFIDADLQELPKAMLIQGNIPII